MAKITLRNVFKFYEKSIEPAVNDFSLEIEDGELIVFVGPSGCGKSTILRMIAGLEDITSGEIYIGEKCVNKLEPKDRDIAMVFQSYALYPYMTVYNNIAFYLKQQRISDVKRDKAGDVVKNKKGNPVRIKRKYTKEEIRSIIENAAEILEIQEYLHRKPKQLSGGQKQRVAIARTIVRNPKAFLFDEPLSNLDVLLRGHMRHEIMLLHKRLNATMVYVTHDQVEAMTLANRIVIMKDGIVQQVGTPTEVFNTPKNTFVAAFIGTPQMNLIDARLVCEDGRYFARIDECKFPIRQNHNEVFLNKGYIDQDIVLGIRPEHIGVVWKESQKESGIPYIPVKITISEMMGTEIHLHIALGEGEYIVRVPTADLSDSDVDTLMTRGAEVKITFAPQAIHIFNSETKQNLIY